MGLGNIWILALMTGWFGQVVMYCANVTTHSVLYEVKLYDFLSAL